MTAHNGPQPPSQNPHGGPAPQGTPHYPPYGQPTPPYGQPTPPGAPQPAPGQGSPTYGTAGAPPVGPGGTHPFPAAGYPGPGPQGYAPAAPGPQGYGPAGGPPPGAPQAMPGGTWPGGPGTPPQATASGPSSGKGKVWAAVLGGLALLVVASVIVSGLMGGWLFGKSPSDKARDAAESFLTAVADGRSKDALALLSTAPGDASLLTDEVLQKSKAKYPITDIVVTEPLPKSDGLFAVPVTYHVGGTTIQDELTVSIAEKALVFSPTTPLRLNFGIPITVNGVKPLTTYPEVFPGRYDIGTTLEYFSMGANATMTARAALESVDTDVIKPQFTDAGQQFFKQTVASALTACVASTTLDAGCGLQIPATLSDGAKVKEGSIKRKLSSTATASLAALTGKTDTASPGVVTGSLSGVVDVEAQCDTGSGWRGCTITGLTLRDPRIDFKESGRPVRWR